MRATKNNIDWTTIESSRKLPTDDNGWQGYIDSAGKKHRWKVFSGISQSIPGNATIVLLSGFKKPTDLGVIKTGYGLFSFAYGCDWGESFIKMNNGLDTLSIYNGQNIARQANYWCRIEYVEL